MEQSAIAAATPCQANPGTNALEPWSAAAVRRAEKSFPRKPWWHELAYISRALPKAIAELVAELPLPARVRVLDYGCATMPYRALFPPDAHYVGADLVGNFSASLHVLPDGRLPVESGSFDVVLSSQVLEHVDDPALYLAECFRVLKPGGRLVLSTHGTMRYHTVPVDYWRWTGEGLKRIVGLAGFRLDKLVGVMGLAPTGLQLFQDGTFRHLPKPLRPPYLLLMQLMIALFDRLHSPRSRESNALVFAVSAQKPQSLAV